MDVTQVLNRRLSAAQPPIRKLRSLGSLKTNELQRHIASTLEEHLPHLIRTVRDWPISEADEKLGIMLDHVTAECAVLETARDKLESSSSAYRSFLDKITNAREKKKRSIHTDALLAYVFLTRNSDYVLPIDAGCGLIKRQLGRNCPVTRACSTESAEKHDDLLDEHPTNIHVVRAIAENSCSEAIQWRLLQNFPGHETAISSNAVGPAIQRHLLDLCPNDDDRAVTIAPNVHDLALQRFLIEKYPGRLDIIERIANNVKNIDLQRLLLSSYADSRAVARALAHNVNAPDLQKVLLKRFADDEDIISELAPLIDDVARLSAAIHGRPSLQGKLAARYPRNSTIGAAIIKMTTDAALIDRILQNLRGLWRVAYETHAVNMEIRRGIILKVSDPQLYSYVLLDYSHCAETMEVLSSRVHDPSQQSSIFALFPTNRTIAGNLSEKTSNQKLQREIIAAFPDDDAIAERILYKTNDQEFANDILCHRPRLQKRLIARRPTTPVQQAALAATVVDPNTQCDLLTQYRNVAAVTAAVIKNASDQRVLEHALRLDARTWRIILAAHLTKVPVARLLLSARPRDNEVRTKLIGAHAHDKSFMYEVVATALENW